MRLVDEVLERAGRAGLPFYRAENMSAKPVLLELGHLIDGYGRLAEADIDEAVPFHAVIAFDPGLVGDGAVGRHGGDMDDGTVGVIAPAMIGADQRLAVVSPQRQSGAAVDAHIAERRHPVFRAPQHDIGVEQRRAHRLVGEALAQDQRIPAVADRRL